MGGEDAESPLGRGALQAAARPTPAAARLFPDPLQAARRQGAGGARLHARRPSRRRSKICRRPTSSISRRSPTTSRPRSRRCAAPASTRRSSAATASTSATPGNRWRRPTRSISPPTPISAPTIRTRACRRSAPPLPRPIRARRPDAFSALGYDTARLLMAAIASAGSKAAGGAQGAGRDDRLCRRDRHHQLSRRQPHPGEIGQHHCDSARPPVLAASVLPEKIPPP